MSGTKTTRLSPTQLGLFTSNTWRRRHSLTPKRSNKRGQLEVLSRECPVDAVAEVEGGLRQADVTEDKDNRHTGEYENEYYCER